MCDKNDAFPVVADNGRAGRSRRRSTLSENTVAFISRWHNARVRFGFQGRRRRLRKVLHTTLWHIRGRRLYKIIRYSYPNVVTKCNDDSDVGYSAKICSFAISLVLRNIKEL